MLLSRLVQLRRRAAGGCRVLCSESSVRVRYAPSPTGALHLGGLRTALMNYLFARQSSGAFVLRIEDTDRKRLVPGATESILRTLRSLGLRPDEDSDVGGPYGPYVQSERTALYRRYADELVSVIIDVSVTSLQRGAAYPCFCSEERLSLLKKTRGPYHGYDRHCRHLPQSDVESRLRAGESHTIRMLIPEGTTQFNDLVYGSISIQNSELDDQILLKADGFPTYHLASVVDDHLMRISHVIRGDDWLSSTPKQLILYCSLEWAPPIYCHLPLLLNANKSKLSKRQGDQSVENFLQRGFLPEALVNYTALAGFTPKLSKTVPLLLPELISSFSFESLHKSAPVVDSKQLQFVNREFFRHYYETENWDRLMEIFSSYLDLGRPREENLRYVRGCRGKIRLTTDIPDYLSGFYHRPSVPLQQELLHPFPRHREIASDLLSLMGSPLSDDSFDSFLTGGCEKYSLEKKDLQMILRLLLTGTSKGVNLHQLVLSLSPGEISLRLSQFLSSPV